MARPQEIGTFTPEQARLIWLDYQERKQLQPQLQQNFPRRRQLDEPSPHRLFIRSSENETLPAYGCVEITTTVIVSGRTVIEVRKPATLTGEYLFVSQFPIPPKNDLLGITGIGWAYRYGIVRMLGTPPFSPRQYRPIVGSYEVEEGPGPFVVFGDDAVATGVLVGRIGTPSGSSIIILTPSGGIPPRSGNTLGSAVCSVYSISGSNELVDTETSAEVLNMTATPVEGDVFGQAKQISGRWVIDVEECEEDQASSV
jgi:hypothetical protein